MSSSSSPSGDGRPSRIPVDFSPVDLTLDKRRLSKPDARAAACKQNHPCRLSKKIGNLEAPILPTPVLRGCLASSPHDANTLNSAPSTNGETPRSARRSVNGENPLNPRQHRISGERPLSARHHTMNSDNPRSARPHSINDEKALSSMISSSPKVPSRSQSTASTPQSDVNPFLFSGLKLDFTKALNSVKNKCECCTASGDPLTMAFPEVPMTLRGRRRLNPSPTTCSFAEELWDSFGDAALKAILAPDIRPEEVHQIGDGDAGLNHVFVAKVRSWFVKAVMFESAATSEAQQMEHLKQRCPMMMTDPTLIFPIRWCRIETEDCSYDVLVYPFENGVNVRDLVRVFDQSPKQLKAQLWPTMVMLMGASAEILRRYHLTHRRKHGDAKSDNFMVTDDGRILLCDHGVNSLTMCEKNEFTRSMICVDPEVAKLKIEFANAFETAVGKEMSEEQRTQIRFAMRQLTGRRPVERNDAGGEETEGFETSVRAAPTPLIPKTASMPHEECLMFV